MRYILMPVVHGVQFSDIDNDFAKPFIDKIRSHLTEKERDYLIPMPINYSQGMNKRQIQAFEATDKGLDNEKLRLLKHTAGSDITHSLIQAKGDAPSFFKTFNYDLASAIADKRAIYKEADVICVGHSQGSQLLYSFFFEYFGKIDGFISMGSPISMNSGAWPDWGKRPDNLLFWDNFYHSSDFISSRLETHPSESIRQFVNDFEVPKGFNPLYHAPSKLNLFGYQIRWTKLVAGLMAHTCYWKNDFVCSTIAQRLKWHINL